MKIGETSARHGEWIEVPVTVASVGNEHALGFSLSFDPVQLEFADALPTDLIRGSTINVNSDQGKAGTLGIVLALPWGRTLPGGESEVLHLKFRILPAAQGPVCRLSVQNSPVMGEIVDLEANAVPSRFDSGGITLRDGPGALPMLTITQTSEGLVLSWPRTGSEAFRLEVSGSSGNPVWQAVTTALSELEGNNTLLITPSSTEQYFRLTQR